MLIKERYDRKELLGEGAFGSIYLVYDRETKENAAMKIYKELRQFREEKEIWEMCGEISEAVKILDYFEENETGFLVMEYLPGGTLKEALKKNPKVYHVSEALRVLLPVMEALHQMHGKGLVHCDVSPDNIMFDEFGKAILIDFGTVKSDENHSERVLKEKYAAPEQYANPEKIGPWTDIYAVCAVLYEMTVGEKIPPVTSRMKKDEIEDLRLHIKGYENEAAAVMRGLNLEIQKRYFSMQLFMEACGIYGGQYKELAGLIRKRWGKLWISVSSQGKFAAPADERNYKKRVLRKRFKVAALAAVLAGAAGWGSWYYLTHFQEEKFEKKLNAAMKNVCQQEDTVLFYDTEECFEEKVQYLQEYGDVFNEQEERITYDLTEEEFLEWGVKNNKNRKMYLDYETIKDICLYYLKADETEIASSESYFDGYVVWNKGDPQSISVDSQKTIRFEWGEYLEIAYLEISYDAADKRVFSVEFHSADEEKMKIFMVDILHFCCPETYLTESEAVEILAKIKAEGDVGYLCLNEKAWLSGYGYEMQGDYDYYCKIAASQAALW